MVAFDEQFFSLLDHVLTNVADQRAHIRRCISVGWHIHAVNFFMRRREKQLSAAPIVSIWSYLPKFHCHRHTRYDHSDTVDRLTPLSHWCLAATALKKGDAMWKCLEPITLCDTFTYLNRPIRNEICTISARDFVPTGNQPIRIWPFYIYALTIKEPKEHPASISPTLTFVLL